MARDWGGGATVGCRVVQATAVSVINAGKIRGKQRNKTSGTSRIDR
jgi:hypothetical protein